MRMSPRFEFTIAVDEALEPDLMRIPPMLVQPFVENALLHGIAVLKQGGLLTVGFALHEASEEPSIVCTIEDNGVGRSQAAATRPERMQHKSVGMNVTSERLELIGKERGQPVHLNIADLTDAHGNPRGTKVTLHIPILIED